MRNTPGTCLAAEIAAGDSLGLADLSNRFNVCISTCFRWIANGLPTGGAGRVRLEAIKRGKCWITSEGAITRFFAALPRAEAAECKRNTVGPYLQFEPEIETFQLQAIPLGKPVVN